MPSGLSSVFGDLGEIAGVCPCCGDLIYLSEARPFLAGSKNRSVIDSLRAAEDRLERESEKLDNLEQGLRQAAALAGLKTAKKLLKKIDPVFSGTGYDPQDVKVLFNPITYVIFDGLARGKIKSLSLIAKEPHDPEADKILRSIGKTVNAGNFEFRTVHVDREGAVTHR
jgi:predicted Holliday junction resolvase-like endonuclease